MSFNKKRVAVTIVTAALMIALYCLIFGFSSQTGEESGGLSRMISDECVEIYNNIAQKELSNQEMLELSISLEYPIRKMAHFSEYACLGVLVVVILSQYISINFIFYLVSILWVFVSAVLDEIHQLFVPGRSGNIVDVFIDTSGGIFGICICVFITWIYTKLVVKSNNIIADVKTEG